MSSPSKPTKTPRRRTTKSTRLPQSPLDDLLQKLRGEPQAIPIAGVASGARGHLLSALRSNEQGPFICVTASEETADELARELRVFLGSGTCDDPAVLRLPGEPLTPYELPASLFRKRSVKRLFALSQIASGAPFEALVLSASALLRKQVPPSAFALETSALKVGDFLDRDRLLRDLVDLGFRSVPLVEDPGTFAARGTLLDLFSPLTPQPARLEFFGDELESIRLFDPATQRAHQKISSLRLAPAQELVLTPSARDRGIATILELSEQVALPSTELRALIDDIEQGILPPGLTGIHPGFFDNGLSPLFDFLTLLPRQPIFFFDDTRSIDDAFETEAVALETAFEEANTRGELALPPAAHDLTRAELSQALQRFHLIESQALVVDEALHSPIRFTFDSPTTSGEEDPKARLERARLQADSIETWIDRFQRWREEGLYVALVLGSQNQADKLKRLFEARKLTLALVPGPLPSSGTPDALDLHLHLGELAHGFVDRPLNLAVVAEAEFLAHRAQRRKSSRVSGASKDAEKSFVQAFQSLREGDLVVHTDYGIGRYEGLTRLDLGGMTSDVMVIQYAGKDRVYLPVSRLRLVQKFTGAKAESVTLDRLGSLSWEKRKRAVKEQLLRMASELLTLEAARKAHPGHAFQADEEAFTRFEAGFAFDETPDQQKAIDAVLSDMRAKVPMDRLVCGDVGFGKTEVALRAAFQAVNDGKQVALLVPTTVLAAQHLATFRERFRDEPVRVEMISRLRSTKQNREVLDGLANGTVDIVIGTHRLLASDVSFARLGLLIIDEEHRFGVTHKEKLKRLRQSLDVLTMTATPIPRTLNFALSGLREMSIIASPPVDRKSIRTFVIKDDPGRVAEAIRFELERGGQVFFVHNRVETIEQKREALFQLVPEARFGVAHGQMEQGKLEEIMTEFASGDIDVLVCSSIIESGLDIPSANTILIDRADNFGLAQLYQIRGRVGRGTERAYAYLLIPAHLPLRREAAKRLEVLQSFTELGAGFHIAAHDLEIRGAGNLLGKDQSGQIAAVGFDLYCELLEQAVGEIKGEPPREEIEPEINLPIPAYFPEEYLPDLSLRLVFYKRLAEAQDEEALLELRDELRDRFGDLPLEVERLVDLMALKVRLRRARLRALESSPKSLILTLGPDSAIDPAALMRFVQEDPNHRRLTPQMKLVVALREERARIEDLFEEAHRLLDAVERLERVEDGE
ncbi:MAG: transcription-repair coupling factor [Myxococcales bacterium]|jgi:transcription-repair coupling factor (superfamily II helicase)|nr:transcription-repair coupling factor [Myxococcales bacterium]